MIAIMAPMPSPPKTTDARIVAATRKLLEKHGRDGFSLVDIASAVGVRAPSLYKRFADRAALIAAVELGLWHEFGEAIARVPSAKNPVELLTAHAHTYRAFAKAHPRLYALVYDAAAEQTEAGLHARTKSLEPTLLAFAALVGQRDALSAARVLIPFLHGFVSMELANAFRFGSSLDAAFAYGVATILEGLRTNARAQSRPHHKE
jgi:AcrR family transcriptional regulator